MDTVFIIFLKLLLLSVLIPLFLIFFVIMMGVAIFCSCFTYQYIVFSCNVAQYILWNLIQLYYRLTFNNVKIRGIDKIEKNKNYVFVCNHVGAFDFFLTTEIMRMKNLFMQVRYILKDEFLDYIPFSWAMKFGGHCFLSKNFKKDEKTIKNLRNFLIFMKNKSVVLYPEGTRITQKSKDNSDLFCENNNIVKMKHTLYPRKKGFNLIRDEMGDIFPEVISLTYTIEKNKIPSLWTVLFGGIDNTKIYIDINKYSNKRDLDIANIFYDMDEIIEKRRK